MLRVVISASLFVSAVGSRGRRVAGTSNDESLAVSDATESSDSERLFINPRKADKYKRTADEPTSYYPSIASYHAAALHEYRDVQVSKPYSGKKKMLVLCSSSFLLPTHDGRLFNTGHHSTEMLLPLHHFDAVGFSFDFATEEGKPVALEEWTFELAKGYQDKLEAFRRKFSATLTVPLRYSDITDLSAYAAVFIPGGHGPLISMQYNADLGKILRKVHQEKLRTISLCHGPVAFAATALGGDFAYEGYRFSLFPDKVDDTSPKFGYLPSSLDAKYKAEAKLNGLGMTSVNIEMDRTVVVDRELITGASQLASQPLAEKAISILAEELDFEASF